MDSRDSDADADAPIDDNVGAIDPPPQAGESLGFDSLANASPARVDAPSRAPSPTHVDASLPVRVVLGASVQPTDDNAARVHIDAHPHSGRPPLAEKPPRARASAVASRQPPSEEPPPPRPRARQPLTPAGGPSAEPPPPRPRARAAAARPPSAESAPSELASVLSSAGDDSEAEGRESDASPPALSQGGGDIVAGAADHRAVLRLFILCVLAIVTLCLSLAPEGATQWRWSDGSYFTSEVNGTGGTAVSTSYVLASDLYGGALGGVVTTRAADGSTAVTSDKLLAARGSFWDFLASSGCLSSFLGNSQVCRALSALLGIAVFARIALTCAALGVATALVGVTETAVLCFGMGRDPAPALHVHATRLWRYTLPGAALTFVVLITWPITVSVALGYVRDELLRGGTIAATSQLVRPGGGYFFAVAGAALLIWVTRESRARGGAQSAVRDVAALWQRGTSAFEGLVTVGAAQKDGPLQASSRRVVEDAEPPTSGESARAPRRSESAARPSQRHRSSTGAVKGAK